MFLSPFSLAKEAFDKAFLQKEFGQDLTKAPFFLRFTFSKEFKKDWEKSDYLERKVFLTNYETNLAAEQTNEKAEAKAAASEEKERLREKKEALRKEKERLKAQLAEERAEKKADEGRQKEFNTSVSDQQKELNQMRHRQAAQGFIIGPSQESDQGSGQVSY